MTDRGREWPGTDGPGGFPPGPVAGPRTRRYHGLLVAATTPPTGRTMLVSGFDATVETPGGRWMLSTQRYAPDILAGEDHLESFELAPWPTWTFRLPDGTRLVHELLMRKGAPQVFLAWRLAKPPARPAPTPDLAWARLTVRPFLAGRDFHALMHENESFSFEPVVDGERFRFRPYEGGPRFVVTASGRYERQPLWYRRFVYQEERRRGLDCEEDLGAPGVWTFELAAGEAAMVFAFERDAPDPETVPASAAVESARAFERER